MIARYRKIILVLLGSLLFVWLWFLTISCASKKKPMLPIAVAAFKHDWIVFENNRLMDNDKLGRTLKSKLRIPVI